MVYISQLQGQGRSSTAQFYAIRDLGEEVDFLNEPYLGKNPFENSQALFELETDNAVKYSAGQMIGNCVHL